ncbi:TSUP family transporter [Aurantimonas aggregata]|uniref:Probable membrane transporter protein n=1 Tax=Aurantimonas aggregata TaxID=2047720 RepID=A0A6L9MCA2_9HYPH|nr:sulfite exporter TauE/SafE family protein [Aurantimonas aggregata]NDV85300.1 TSUP family transporter [Aurantimonas aggregata]
MSFDLASLLALLIPILIAAAAGGFLAGLFGIGGGAIYVPILYQTFETLGVDHAVTMHLAVGSSIAIIVPTSVRSLVAHWRKDVVDWRLLREWTVAVPLGAIAGVVFATYASSETLRGIFAVLATILGIKMLFGRVPYVVAQDLPGLAGRSVAGFAIGVFSALMGIGGGVLNNTFMTLFNRPMIQAVATSAGVGALISIPGLVAYIVGGWGDPLLPPYSFGFVSLAAVAIIAPASILAVPGGAALAHRLSRRQLEIGFGCFLLLVAARFIYSLL